jgi:phosphate transport system protein
VAERLEAANEKGLPTALVASVRTDVQRMADMVCGAVRSALGALESGDQDQARAVISGDAAIDAMEEEIERRCLHLLTGERRFTGASQRQMRTVAAAFKMVTDLERIGDHASSIARTVLRIDRGALPKPFLDIPRMAVLAEAMLRKSVAAFVNNDTVAARAAAMEDDDIDGMYDQVFRELLTYMLDDRDAVRQATHLLFVSSAIERIADHATNLAEWEIYAETGHRVELNA